MGRAGAWGPVLVLVLVACGGLEDGPHEPTEARPDELDIDTTQLGLIDCAERTDTGYVNGNPFPINVVTVDGKPVERETANAYWVMQQAAAADGVQIAIVSGFRTMAQQQYLYDCYVNCNCNNCNLAAVPGYSNHQSGHALDLNTSSSGVLAWLNARGAEFGFSRTVPSEDWHWEWWGGGPGGGPCGGCAPSCNGSVITATDCSTEDCAVGGQTCVDDSFGVRCEPVCEPLPGEGGVIEEAGSCFFAFGPNQFWRSVEGEGHGGSLLWTNAFENDTPSNWGRWSVNLSAGGDYDVDVYLEPAYAVHAGARYEVRHGGLQTVVFLDQSAGNGWMRLGTFTFESGDDQWVSVYDDTGPVAPEQHIAVDALRLTPFVDPNVPEDPNDPNDPTKPEDPGDPAERPLIGLVRDLPETSIKEPGDVLNLGAAPEPEAPVTAVAPGEIGGGCGCHAAHGSLPGRTPLLGFWILAALAFAFRFTRT